MLSPLQAARVRRIGENTWSESAGGGIDTKKAYACNLPSGRTLSIFFYDQQVSRDIAFGGLLRDGGGLARRLVEGFDHGEGAQLVNTATDGETYGHHHPLGDMALAYCFYYIESNRLAKITNYGEFLEKHRPEFEVRVRENTSWSCVHGVERWRSNCGCVQLQNPGWSQDWRRPLRVALDWLRDVLATLFVKEASKHLADPWKARDDYVTLVLDSGAEETSRFLEAHTIGRISPEDGSCAIRLLEMERCAMLMFASCGWFWDDVSRLETVQVLRYAGRAIQLAGESTGVNVEPQFVRMLEEAPSNSQQFRNGAEVFKALVEPEVVQSAVRRKGAP